MSICHRIKLVFRRHISVYQNTLILCYFNKYTSMQKEIWNSTSKNMKWQIQYTKFAQWKNSNDTLLCNLGELCENHVCCISDWQWIKHELIKKPWVFEPSNSFIALSISILKSVDNQIQCPSNSIIHYKITSSYKS